MKWFILAVTVVVLAIDVESHADEKYEPQALLKLRPCYESSELRDKARSLPMTLDYFLYLVEKVQRHRDMMSYDAASMASVLIARFQLNGIQDDFAIDGYKVTVDAQPELSKSDIVNEFLKPRPGEYVENTLLPEEQCALHYMLSWSNNMTNPSKTDSDYDPNYTNFNVRSTGLVYSGLFGNLALGPVLQGIAMDRTILSKTVGEIIEHLKGGNIYFGDDNSDSIMVNTLLNTFASTISAELGQSAVWLKKNYHGSDQPYVGPKGYWNSTYCPSNYTLYMEKTDANTLFTAAEIVGAIDGFLIATKLQEETSLAGGVKLAQVIRMYYGKGLVQNSYNACERKNRYNGLTANVQQQSLYFAYAYASVSKTVVDVSDLDTYLNYVMTAFQRDYLENNFLDCNQSNSLYFSSRAQKYEFKNDILFMIDVDNKNSDDGFWEQKEFVMNLMREMDSLLNGSRYGLYTNGGGSRQLFPLDPNYSSARRRCEILQGIIDPTSTNMPDAIRYIKEVIRNLKNTQRSTNVALAPGKVIIFVYLESEFKNKEDVEREIQDLKWEHPDVTLLAVGRNAEPLKLLVRDIDRDLFVKSGEPIVFQVPKILSRLTTSPVTIEYPKCSDSNHDDEGNFVATEFVYSNTYQWFSVPQIYFNTSGDMRLQIRSDYGTVRVCSTRQRPESFTGTPSFDSDKCKDVTTSSTGTNGEPVGLFGPMEPCYDYPDGGCPNFYFQVQGKSKSATEVCKNNTCDSLHQIQLTITHTGMRCAGSFTGVEISFLVMSVLVSVFTLWA